MSIPCKLLIDSPADGAWNMAVDEALLDRAAAEGRAALRFYQWRQPTLSLGYFQAFADREAFSPSLAATVIRRLSGGGALVHDRELTYSLCLPPSHPLSRQSTSVYELVHRALVDALDSLGFRAEFHGSNCPSSIAPAEPFLCFARRTGYDIVMKSDLSKPISALPRAEGSTAKIAGSAQRRSRGALLQHGGVLLALAADAGAARGARDLRRLARSAGAD